MTPLSIYLHIPFCRHRCSYCDFNTYTSLGDLQTEYVAALLKEIREVAGMARQVQQLRPAETLFFGGGTPSLLAAEQVRSLIDGVEAAFGFVPGREVTLEANPETVAGDYLAAIRQAGVNRLSFGMQSADAAELTLLGRTHGVDTVYEAVNKAQAAGFTNFNLDLIYGLPDQNMAGWERSLSTALEMKPPHLSLYCLTIEEGTPMYRWLRDGRIAIPDPDQAAEQYEAACRILDQAGYRHYEISNWALPGYECRHNLAYWRDHEFLGFGAGAHGKAFGQRYSLVRQPRVYIRRMSTDLNTAYPLSSAVAESHVLDRLEAMSDRVITQLRLLQEGLDLMAFKEQFGQTIDEAFDRLPGQLETWGLLRREDGRLLLTDRGRFISNQVFYRFV
ncbi:MAG: radical SAM family heme chaperone HemW [Candidatus Promineifilaceae bacterium]